jgi:hypothetical protein
MFAIRLDNLWFSKNGGWDVRRERVVFYSRRKAIRELYGLRASVPGRDLECKLVRLGGGASC